MNYLTSWQIFGKRRKILFQKKKFLKWECSDDFISDIATDSDITLLKCKICRKYTAQIKSKARWHNLHGQILDRILSHGESVTYIHKVNVYNHVKAGGLHNWAKKKL